MDLPEKLREVLPTGSSDYLSPVKRAYYNSSFYAKMLVGGLLLITLIAALGGMTVMDASSATNEQVTNNFETTTVSQADQVDFWRETRMKDAAAIGASPGLADEPTKEEARSIITSESNRAGESVMAVHYVDTTTDTPTVIASTIEEYEGKNGADLGVAWSDTSVEQYNGWGTVVTTAPYESSVASGPVMAFVSPVDGDDDRAVVMVVNLRDASTSLSAPTSGQSFVVNEEGTVVLSTTPRHIGQDAYELGVMNEEAWETAPDNVASFKTPYIVDSVDYNDEDMVTGVVHMEQENWVVASQSPQSVAYETQDVVQQSILVLIVASIVAVISIGAALGIPTIRDLNRLSRRADEVSRGNFDTELQIDRTDEIGQVYQSVNRMRTALDNRIEEVEKLNRNLESSVREFNDVMEACADGDLTQRMDTDTGVEALDTLAVDFNEMMADLDDVISETKEFGDAVGTASEEATQNIQQVEETSATVAEAAQEISDNASRQNEMLDEAVSEMNSLSSTIEEVAASTDEVASQATQTAEISHEGREAASDAASSLEDIEAQTESVSTTVESLNEEVEEIEEVIDYIQNVAKQTNMLAINAGIEAARAGEAGEGFGVVADEVKQLADDANDAAEDIEESLVNLQEKAEETKHEIDDMQERVDEGSDTIVDALDALDEIAGSVDETVTGIQEIDEATERQAESAQEVVNKVDSVSDISSETVEQAEDVAAATEEQSASVEQISDSITHLSEQAVMLRDQLEQFDTEE